MNPLPVALLIFICLPGIDSQQTFSLGQTIATAGGAAVSTGDFSFGFTQPDRSSSSFELGLWFSADSTRFLLWRTRTAAASGATTRLTVDGDLAVTSPSGVTVWSAGAEKRGADTAQLLSSGDFVLRNASGAAVWSSFENPVDTLLPNQSITAGGPELTTGVHSLAMDTSGNLTLRWNRRIVYWSGAPQPASYAAVDANGVLRLFENSSRFIREIFASDFGSPNGKMRRLTLDPDGNLRFYTLSGSSWVQQWQAVDDQCKIFGFCGSYGVCSYRDGIPRCTCPDGLRFISDNNRTAGCTGTGNLTQCAASNNRMVEVRNAAWLNLTTQESSTFNSNQEQCKSTCLAGTGCIGAISPNDGSGICTQIQSAPLSGYSSPSIHSTAFLKVCNGAANSPPLADDRPTSPRGSARDVGIAVAVTILAVAAVEGVLGFFLYRRRRRATARHTARYAVLDYASGAAIRFSYKELQNATYNFSNKIGEGGFGAVYRGFLPPLPMMNKGGAIAVKKLEGVFQGEKEFRTEVATIGSTHHMNLMRLVGFCSEGDQTRLLVYDFMPNGSLDRFLFHHPHDRAGRFYSDDEVEAVVRDGSRSRSSARRIDVKTSEVGGGTTESDDRGLRTSRRAASERWKTRRRGVDVDTRAVVSEGGGRTRTRIKSESEDRDSDLEAARGVGYKESSEEEDPTLDWKTRFRVAVGAARGLAYLHEECRETIVHCDLKPENILLDENFTPKLSDFGLARLIEPGQTRELTTVRGSRGYMAPEWLANMPVTAKSDVYSYGVVLLELVGGRRNFDSCSAVPREQQRYSAWAFRELEAGRVEAIVDERLGGEFDVEEVERVVKVAFWCIQENGGGRPSMSKVVRMLEGNAEVLRPPMPRSLMVAESSSSVSFGGGGRASSSSTSATTLPSSVDSVGSLLR